MEPVPNPLLLSYMDITSVPNPLLNVKEDDDPVPDPLTVVANVKEVASDMCPSTTMLEFNDGFTGEQTTASYTTNDLGSINFFLSEVQPTNVLNMGPIHPVKSVVTLHDASDEDVRAHDHVSVPPSPPARAGPASDSNMASPPTISATPPPIPSDITTEQVSYAAIVDDDSSKEGRQSPGGNDSILGGEEARAVPAVAGAAAGKRSAAPAGTKMKKRKYRTGGGDARMSEERKVERRERNREHAKKSRIRKKFFTESMQEAANRLREENAKLRNAVHKQLGDQKAQEVLMARLAAPNVDGLHASRSWEGGRCSEAILAAARELAVTVAMNNMKERSGVGVTASTNT